VPEAVVSAIRLSDNTLLRSLGFSLADGAGEISFFPDRSQALLGGSNLKIIDTTSFVTVDTIAIPASGSVVFTPDGIHAYVPLPSENEVAVLSTVPEPAGLILVGSDWGCSSWLQ
jgi:hypothetical protein